MCGIAGTSHNPQDKNFNTAHVAAALLSEIEYRGRHATGAAWYRPADDTLAVTKLPVTATTFLKHRGDLLPTATPVMLLHTRYATHGNTEDRNNNHPIQHDNILGIHNGVLQNHVQLFKELGATPGTPVDSEAIMALLNSAEHPTDVLGRLRGDAAIAWVDLRDPAVLHLARVSGRPLTIAQTRGGSLIFASTMFAVEAAAKAAGLDLTFREDVPEAKYLRVVNGSVTDYLDIDGVVKADDGWRKQYEWTSGTGAAKSAPKASGSTGGGLAFSHGPKALTGRTKA